MYAAVGWVISWFLGLELPETPGLLLAGTVTFGAIASGFVGTSLSILTCLGTPVMTRIKKTSYVGLLRSYLGQALLSGVLLSCVSLAGLFWGAESGMFAATWVSALVFCIACLYRLSAIMLRVFSDPDNIPES